jgi:hypothetical protein
MLGDAPCIANPKMNTVRQVPERRTDFEGCSQGICASTTLLQSPPGTPLL